jgi:hypothetical protein
MPAPGLLPYIPTAGVREIVGAHTSPNLEFAIQRVMALTCRPMFREVGVLLRRFPRFRQPLCLFTTFTDDRRRRPSAALRTMSRA